MEQLGYPGWVRLAHFFHLLFLSLLVRSGIEILGAHPRLYWNDDCTPGSEWLRFTDEKMPDDQLWTAEDEIKPYNSWVALPGRDNLGLSRYWHFASVIGWVLTGLVYVVLLIVTPHWRRLIPTSWAVFPEALEVALAYLQFDFPEPEGTYNAFQQLTYAFIVFVASPLQMLSGVAMAPSVAGRFRWFTDLFGGRQAARSLHFLGLVVFTVFTLHHVGLVVAHGFGEGMANIVLGTVDPTAADRTWAIWIGLGALAAVVLVHVWATRASLGNPRTIQHILQRLVDPVRQALLGGLQSRQSFDRDQVTAHPRPNGRPPKNDEYRSLLDDDFEDWQFEVEGLVDDPLALTLEELRELPASRQITRHACIQGWSYIAEWEGVRVSELLDRCGPTDQAEYLLFETFDERWENEGHGLGCFYTVIDLAQAREPQTLLAYGMNGEQLRPAFGAPLRLRLESQLGFKMAKYVRRLRLIEDYRDIGEGHANWRADYLYYSKDAPI